MAKTNMSGWAFQPIPGPSGDILWHLEGRMPWLDAHTLITSLGIATNDMGTFMLPLAFVGDRGLVSEAVREDGEPIGTRTVVRLPAAIAMIYSPEAPNRQAMYEWLVGDFLPAVDKALDLGGPSEALAVYRKPAAEETLLQVKDMVSLLLRRSAPVLTAGLDAAAAVSSAPPERGDDMATPTPGAVPEDAGLDAPDGEGEAHDSETPMEGPVDDRKLIMGFLAFALPQCKWDLLPFPFLYMLYSRWMEVAGNRPVKRAQFIDCILDELERGGLLGWSCPGRSKVIRPAKRMQAEEPLLDAYGIPASLILGKASYVGLLRDGH